MGSKIQRKVLLVVFVASDSSNILALGMDCVCVVIYQLLNCGRAQARKRKSSPIEPLKAKATNAEICRPNVLCCWSIVSVDKEMLTCYLWLPPSWIEIILVTAVQLMLITNQRPRFFLRSTFRPISSQYGEAGLIQWKCNFVSQWEGSKISVLPV